MNRKEGFTLIELLAVILVLGIIALIAVPTVSKIVKEAKVKSYSVTMSNIKDVLYNKCIYELNTNKEITTKYTINKGKIDKNIDIKGKLPDKATAYISNDCNVDIVGEIGGYQVINVHDNSITIPISNEFKIENDELSNRLIYKGGNPNNYIKINDGTPNNIYRIILYENDGTIKVKKNTTIDALNFDFKTREDIKYGTYCTNNDNCNAFGKVEGNFINGTVSGTVLEDSAISKRLQTFYDNLSKDVKDLIVYHSFNIGETLIGSDKCADYTKIENDELSSKWNGYIGLITVSDYLKATTNEDCKQNIYTESGTNNYLNNGSIQWTLTPQKNTYNSHILIFYSGKFLTAYSSSEGTGTYPAFYLKNNVKLSGEGTLENSFIIQ